MTKYKCEKCGAVWYTSNTNNKKTCEKCNGKLKKEKK
jgi:predicted nucleic acid-binding Zn ribbon protein